MKEKFALLFVLFYCIKTHSQVLSPSVINATGGTFQSGYYQLEWSIGELSLVGDMVSGDNSFVITNGFIQSHIQQPWGTNTNNIFGNDEIRVFPNPATNYVEVNFLTKQKGRITINIYDGAGKKIHTTSDTYYGDGLIKRIPVTHLPNEVYMLHINLDPAQGFSAKKGIYKIIKIK